MVHPRHISSRRTTLAGGAFSPDQLPSMVLWLDASDASSITLSGSDVVGWSDKSGTGNDVAEVTTPPSLSVAAQNGLDGVYFDGTELISKSSPVSLDAWTNFSAFVVASNEDESNSAIMMGIYDTTGSDATWCYRKNPSESVQFFLTFDGSTLNTLTSADDKGAEGGAFYAGFVYNDGVGRNLYTSGASASGGTSGASHDSSADFIIGDSTSADSPWTGHVYEVIIYNTSVSSGDRATIKAYLDKKWGL